MDFSSRRSWFAWGLLALLLAGCSANHYQKSADMQAYGIVREKTPQVKNMERNFTIEQTNVLELARFPVYTNAEEFLGPDADIERGARMLRLEDALEIAVKNSRRYQSEKETLYLSALTLTSARHEFAPIFSASGNVGYEEEVTEIRSGGGLSDRVVESRGVRAGGGGRVSWLLRDVGRISAAVTADAVRFISGNQGWVTSSRVVGTFSRPLLRNAGFKAEVESLTQAERSVLYDVRDFVQFRKDFSVEVATAYYGVLGRRDVVRNSYLALQSSRRNAERSRALGREGRQKQSDLGRLGQQELSAEGAWISAVRSYKQELDNFKILLGLSVENNLVLDESELRGLQILDPQLSEAESIRVAMASRLDYQTTKDRLADAERQVELTKNFLKPQADLVAGVSASSDPTPNAFRLPDFQQYSWNAGLEVDPDLDRLSERNAYRQALISRNRASRAVEQSEDDIQLRVRDSWRTLDQAKRSYEISDIGVKLAERRVEEQNLLAELGRANALDQVDAENSLNDSRNQRVQALVTHTIARLTFWNRLGILYIKDNGQWEETEDAKTQ